MNAGISNPAAVQPVFSEQWQDWLAGNIARGCLDSDLERMMVDGGFDPLFARTAISIMATLARRTGAGPTRALATYMPDPIRLPARARVDAAGREVSIAFVLENPNIALIEDLLDAEECAEMIRLSAGKLRRSQVVDKSSGRFEVSQVRTSEGTHFARGENALISRIEARIATLTGIPVECGEPLQILHYSGGGQYLAHHDYFDPSDPGSAAHLHDGGQRVATAVIYLNHVDAGGHTVFPELELAVRPRPGSAVYFEYCNSTGLTDTRCLHAGAPVEHGEKWIATKWLRQEPYFRSA